MLLGVGQGHMIHSGGRRVEGTNYAGAASSNKDWEWLPEGMGNVGWQRINVAPQVHAGFSL